MKKLLVSIITLQFISTNAMGWGSYGHQQINVMAIKIIQNTPTGKCFDRNKDLIQRLAITPDYEWKWGGVAPTNPIVKSKKSYIDRFEHHLHYFEPDAFLEPTKISSDSITNLPSGIFRDIVSQYQNLLRLNIDYVLKIDPNKKFADKNNPSEIEVEAHGTAPWRIQQLYELAVDALKGPNPNLPLAQFYLGTLGHYVGDMSQPFHASLNYDGQYPANAKTKGIHSDFETNIFKDKAAGVKDIADKNTKLYNKFEATEREVLKHLAALNSLTDKQLSPLKQNEIVLETFKLAASSYALVEPLLKAYADSGPGNGPNRVKKFANTKMTLDKTETNVFGVATHRMAQSAALLARIWLLAVEDSKVDAKAIENCAQDVFAEDLVIERYPFPEYLPKNVLEHLKVTPHKSSGS